MAIFQQWCKEILPIVQAAADGEEIEYYCMGYGWLPKNAGMFDSSMQYRIKPRTVKVNGFEVPGPMKVAPSNSVSYWVPVVHFDEWCVEYKWANDIDDFRLLEKGLCHTTKEAATAHAKAMLGIAPNQHEE